MSCISVVFPREFGKDPDNFKKMLAWQARIADLTQNRTLLNITVDKTKFNIGVFGMDKVKCDRATIVAELNAGGLTPHSTPSSRRVASNFSYNPGLWPKSWSKSSIFADRKYKYDLFFFANVGAEGDCEFPPEGAAFFSALLLYYGSDPKDGQKVSIGKNILTEILLTEKKERNCIYDLSADIYPVEKKIRALGAKRLNFVLTKEKK